MRISKRKATEAELRAKYRDITWFEFRRRRLAREEAQEGLVEELRFSVARVWRQFTCDGSPCCPNAWFIETDEGLFVEIDSWDALEMVDEQFPGTEVTAVRWPRSMRLISASVSGQAVQPESLRPDALIDLADHYIECVVNRVDDLPDSIRAIVRAA